MLNNLKVALVHDWLNQIGGAENVLEELVDLFPGAPVYTSMYAPKKMPTRYRSWDIRTSFMQKLPGILNHHQPYMPLYPLAFQRMMLTDYDLVLSNKSGFCHGVVTKKADVNAVTAGKNLLGKNAGASNSVISSGISNNSVANGSFRPDATVDNSSNIYSPSTHSANSYIAPPLNRKTVHVCYCLTPTRFLWLYKQYSEREQIGSIMDILLQPLLSLLRRWDKRAAQQVDHFIAISTEIQKRIKDIYGRDSVVIHPPVDTDYFVPAEDNKIGDYFLSIGRLIPYKRVDLTVDAFAQLPDQKLIVVGVGRDYEALSQRATPNVTFLGRQSRDNIRELLQYCRAFIFPGLEDFGIAPVEALSTGRPVIAYKGGGALDTIEPGVTGEFFTEATVDSLVQTVQDFDAAAYNPICCRMQAEKFSTASFRHKLISYLEEVVASDALTGNTFTGATHALSKCAKEAERHEKSARQKYEECIVSDL